MWITPEINKLDIEGELAGLKMAMNNMVESQKRGKPGGNGQYQDCKSRDLSIIDCFRCHKKGTFQDNPSLANLADTSSGNEENISTHRSETSTTWRYKRTENGYPKTKVVNDNTYTFSINVEGGTQLEAGTPQMITRQRRI